MNCVIEPINIPEQGIYNSGKRRWDNGLEFRAAPVGELEDIENPNLPHPTVSMVCLGRSGRWGNTLLQYLFLRALALKYSLGYESPEWVGRYLFGHADPPVKQIYHNIVIDNMSSIHDPENHYEWPLNPSGQRAWYVANRLGRKPFRIRAANPQDRNSTHLPLHLADLDGLFMVHTRHYRDMRTELRSIVQATPEIQDLLKPCVEQLRARGKTLVGLHLRRGDFTTCAMKQNFELVTPASTYLRWLNSIWGTLDEPVLFVASDDIDAVVPAFSEFNPVTSKDLGAHMPGHMKDLDLPSSQFVRSVDFFPDWYLLTQCDMMAISNSTFSFTAAMFGREGATFVRPTFNNNELVRFDPWNSEPVLFPPRRRWIFSEIGQRFQYQLKDPGKSPRFKTYAMAAGSYFGLLLARAYVCISSKGCWGLLKALLTPGFYLSPRVRYDA